MAFDVRFVETSRGARIAFSVEGNGPPLVVLPPWTSHLAGEMALSGHKPFHDLLTEAHTVVRYDRWGTGLSDRDRTDFAPERDIEILAELADHLKLRRFTLLGPSHGGPLAVTYAVRQPRRVSHLVLYGSRASALTSGHTWAALRELILANWPVAARSIAAVATRGSDPGDVDAFTDLLIMAAAPETTVALQDAAIRDELTDLLSKVAVPTLVLHRRDDELVSANEAVQLAARIPGARLELVDGSAHIHTAGDAAALAVRICAFTSGGHRSPSAQLSSREAEVLALAAAPRLDVVAGDFFTSPLPDANAYVLMNILHDWDDDPAIAILSAVGQARRGGAAVLLLEAVMPEGPQRHWSKTLDVLMLAVTGGRERTLAEYRDLLSAADIDLVSATPTATPFSIVEGRT